MLERLEEIKIIIRIIYFIENIFKIKYLIIDYYIIYIIYIKILLLN